jgi:hypothetical protein
MALPRLSKVASWRSWARRAAIGDDVPRGGGVCVRMLHGQPLARADPQLCPSIDPIERLVRGHLGVPLEDGRHTVRYP